jgi:hypothetical protein
VHLARGRGDQHVVALGQVAPARERLPERGEAERDRTADRLRIGAGEQGELRRDALPTHPLGRPAHRLQLQRARPPLDVLAVRIDLGRAAEGRRPDRHRDPLRDLRQRGVDLLRGQVCVGRGEVEVEPRLLRLSRG